MDTINPKTCFSILAGLVLLGSVFAIAQPSSPSQVSTNNADEGGGLVASISSDSSALTDKVHLKNGTVLVGKVIVIKTSIVEFVEQDTNLKYEFSKAEIRVIVLSSGKTLSFSDEAVTPKEQTSQPIPQPVVVREDSGPDVGLVILATVGVVLIVLLIIGAAAN